MPTKGKWYLMVSKKLQNCLESLLETQCRYRSTSRTKTWARFPWSCSLLWKRTTRPERFKIPERPANDAVFATESIQRNIGDTGASRRRGVGKAEGGGMNEGSKPMDLKVRTREFALRVIQLYSALPKTTGAQVIGKQVFVCRCALSRKHSGSIQC